MLENLRHHWLKLEVRNGVHESLAATRWSALEKHYTHKNRHYHNLHHIASMLSQMDDFYDQLVDADCLAYAIWYHDVIYKATRRDNEEKSALFAEAALRKIGWSKSRVERCCDLIISTKKHQSSNANPDLDQQLIIDFDLEILGRPWEQYLIYTQQIRKEYRIYPDLIYRPGRRQALEHFLQKAHIFQTGSYQNKLEMRARENLNTELKSL